MERIEFSFSEQKTPVQEHTVTIPRLKEIQNITSSNGEVTILSRDKDDITVKLTGGRSHRNVQVSGSYTPGDEKYVSGMSSQYYNSDGYTGTLNRYLYSGSYTPRDVRYIGESKETGFGVSVAGNNKKYAQRWRFYWQLRNGVWKEGWSSSTQVVNGSSTLEYNQDGYVGTLYVAIGTGSSFGHTDYPKPSTTAGYKEGALVLRKEYYAKHIYKGEVVRPERDTRVYRYRGTVYKSAVDTRVYDYFYRYTLTVLYEKRGFEAKIRINNQLRDSVGAWVKVNGQLKEIDSLKINVNNQLRES